MRKNKQLESCSATAIAARIRVYPAETVPKVHA